jgi:rare lipoprotein A
MIQTAMTEISLFKRFKRYAGFLMVWAICAWAVGTVPETQAAGRALAKVKPDLSGHTRVGKASIYAKKFAGRKMADGTRMNLHGDNAASKTLPLGTIAMVTHLATGLSALVTIQDRGPYVQGRIVDLSPSTARKIGLTQDQGVAKVKVEPVAVPMPDGSVKPGVAADDQDQLPASSINGASYGDN